MNMRRDGIKFDKEAHKYYYNGNELSGITKIVGKRLGKVFPPCLAEVPRVSEAAEFGTAIHNDIERFIKHGKKPRHPTTAWVIEQLRLNFHPSEYLWASEMLVSDYDIVATAIDFVAMKEGQAFLFDFKTGNFDREYCSWQLAIGAYLLEQDGDIKVHRTGYIVATKEKYIYEVSLKSEERVKTLLYERK
jgi:hypothetical protein